jgi:hypothetical protein
MVSLPLETTTLLETASLSPVSQTLPGKFRGASKQSIFNSILFSKSIQSMRLGRHLIRLHYRCAPAPAEAKECPDAAKMKMAEEKCAPLKNTNGPLAKFFKYVSSKK